MTFTEEFIKSIPDDYREALQCFSSKFADFNDPIPLELELQYYEDYIDAYFAFYSYINGRGLQDDFAFQGLDNDNRTYNIEVVKELYLNIKKTYVRLENADILESSKFKYGSLLQNVFSYRFTDGDLKKIQELINELRNLVNDSNLFSQNHKERLLKRLESLQKELHKRMSNLDKFWGLIGDAGIVMGKFGNDVKPLVDRIKEITEIVWRTQSSAEELPTGSSMPRLD